MVHVIEVLSTLLCLVAATQASIREGQNGKAFEGRLPNSHHLERAAAGSQSHNTRLPSPHTLLPAAWPLKNDLQVVVW